MDDELEVIREQMEGTRASLANKIEALESQVRETVQTASDTVTSAVEGAKDVVSSVSEGAKQVVDTVSETVETVKESLSVSRYVERYPWASMGVAVAAGFTAAQLLPSLPSTLPWDGYESTVPPAAPAASSYQASAPEPPRQEGRSWTTALEGVFGKAAGTLEGLAVGTVMAAVKGLVSNHLPNEWQGELTRLVDDFTTRLGGKVMQGNPMDELLSAFRPGEGDRPTNQGDRL